MSPSFEKFAVTNTDFDSGLTVGGAGVSEKINQYECATHDAATRLGQHFDAIGLSQGTPVLDWPMGSFVTGSPFAQSAKVPYIDFPRIPTPDNPAAKVHVNVAHMLVEYTRYPQKFTDTLLIQKYGPVQKA